jgi:hypothetical protein
MYDVFFDSCGDGWITCPADHPDVVAFGPTGAARPIPVHVGQVRERVHRGLDGWVYLDGPGWDAEGRPVYYG